MGERAGIRGFAGVIVTREARWFFDESASDRLVQWFDEVPGAPNEEVRVDFYDLAAAELSVGLKSRHPANTLDCKMLLSSQPGADLGYGVSGDLEDWIKISQPLGATPAAMPGRVEVRKQTRSKRFFLDASTGCEAELAEVVAAGVVAWTLCFETFGDPDLRGSAFEHGLEVAFDTAGVPERVDLSNDSTSNYPVWVTDLLSASSSVGEQLTGLVSGQAGESKAS